MRGEWGAFDVRAEDGTRVEVKTTGRLQSWTLKKLSTPAWSFKSVRASRVWSEELGDYVTVDPYDRVHVWVFALQTAVDAGLYDPLNMEQWEFRVVPHRQLLATGQTSGRLAFFDRLSISPVTYTALPSAWRRPARPTTRSEPRRRLNAALRELRQPSRTRRDTCLSSWLLHKPPARPQDRF